MLIVLLVVAGNETKEESDASFNEFMLYGGVYLSYTLFSGLNDAFKINMMGT